MRYRSFLFLSFLCTLTCSWAQNGPLLELLPSTKTGVDFRNEVVENPNRHIGYYDYFYNGSGVAIGDFNNDNLPDLFFTGNDVPNQLYLNKGELRFEDISQYAGIQAEKWSTGVSLVDINADGWMDIYVCNSGPTNDAEELRNQLYVNQGNGQFVEEAAKYGIDDSGRSSQAVFFDMDADGDLDLFVMNHSLRNYGNGFGDWIKKMRSLPPEDVAKCQNRLYRNNGDDSFTDISEAAGVAAIGFGLGLVVSDFNEDGRPDIYVANDFFIPDFLYLNNGKGGFVNNIKNQMGHSSYFSMGCDAADFNNDGLVDLSVVDMTPADHFRNKTLMASMNVSGFTTLTEKLGYLPQYMFNSLQLNRGNGVFSEMALQAGVSQTDWSWATLLVDLDNDGWKDQVVTNGYKRDTKDNDWRMALDEIRAKGNYGPEVYYQHLLKAPSNPVPNYLFQNQGDLSFQDKTEDWGFGQTSFSQGAAYGDLDGDGDLELVVNNLGQEAFIYRNMSREKKGNHYLQVKLKRGNDYNAVLGSKIRISYAGQVQMLEYNFCRGYQSYVQNLAHFGLGNQAKIDQLEITWPNGQVLSLNDVEVDQLLVIDQMEQAGSPAQKSRTAPPLFSDATQQLGFPFQHQENSYNDFATEVLLPHRQSMLGPALDVADFNGDGQEDVFIGGAVGQAGQILQQQNRFQLGAISQQALVDDQKAEDTGALWFDYDGDGDQDLYVCSGGGGEIAADSPLLQDRLYENKDGQLIKATDILPKMISSTAVVKAQDWDQDGDLDLFVGGRTYPGQYPLAPSSYLLENQDGKFVDVTVSLAKGLSKIGMVTDAIWTDVNGDQRSDLIVVGEWMPICVLIQDEEGFSDQRETLGLAGTEGWWYSLAAADFDGDGDQDLLVGNLGLNNKFHPSKEKPLRIYGNDFDQSGSLDIVLSKEYKGKQVPVRGKECSTEQMPYLKEKFPTFASFAGSSLENIYGEENLDNAIQYEAYSFASVYLENQGQKGFVIRELAPIAQLAPINAIIVEDLDRDGHLDAILAGNMVQTEVETPSYDAGRGLWLKGDGKGNFSPQANSAETGLLLPLDVKGMARINLANGRQRAIVVANNNGPMQVVLIR